MIKVNNLSKSFADKSVLENVSFTVGKGEVVGLVGKNGAGKTTLLRIILGEVEDDGGNVEVQKETISYLPQYPEFPENITVGEFLKEKLRDKSEKYKMNIALSKIGLKDIDKNIKAADLSGGQKTRLYLVSLLLSDLEPTFLLLDEPTNNLDIEGLNWLEKYILTFKGLVLLTSHDRALLDNLVNKILELEDGKIKIYGGNYSFYKEQKEIEEEAYERMYVVQQKKTRRIKEDLQRIKSKALSGEKRFSSRQPYQRKKIKKVAIQAVSRQKRLEKFLQSEKRLEKPEERIIYRIQVRGKTHKGKTILQVKNLAKSFDNKGILENVSFNIFGNEHVWLYGLNGSGKTTIFKIIIGDLKQDKGKIVIGINVNIGYFSQERQDLNPENTALEELMEAGFNRKEAYKKAVRFYLEEDDLLKTVKELSTGQKAKLAFAKLVSGDYQLLLLDEPTNHLEIETREAIEEALTNFQGAILVGSHDRYFLERIGVDRMLFLEGGSIYNYSCFL